MGPFKDESTSICEKCQQKVQFGQICWVKTDKVEGWCVQCCDDKPENIVFDRPTHQTRTGWLLGPHWIMFGIAFCNVMVWGS